ncbi:hypothetical protein HY212_03950 [Candidatus Pacearchaeota archaeon]|nr:hypothetical protein [Candidatus Pacearchaeota archaeon]
MQRIYLYFFRDSHLVILGRVVHHFWTGLLLIVISLIIYKKYTEIKLILFSIGAGLFFDELVFMLAGGGLTPDYWKLISVIGVLFFALVVFIFRKDIIKIIGQRTVKQNI